MSNAPTAKIPTENIPQLRNKIEKLNKVAAKLELPPITLRVGEPETQQVDTSTTFIDGPYGGQIPGGSQMFQEVVPVWVEGEAPRVNGWEFIATLEHDENGTLIRRIPNFADEVDLSQYRTATPDNCDHCGYKRRRNDTYIVVSETGETKQVGSNCLKDFTGHENPQAIARFLESVRDFIESVSGGGFSEGRLQPRYDLVELMATAVMEIREHGYVSRRVAEETDRTPTAQTVRSEFFNRIQNVRHNGQPVYEIPTDADYEKAEKVIEYIRSLDEDALANDFLYNVYTVCKSGTLTDRQFGIAAAAPLPYNRVNRQREERTGPERVDEFLGEEGGRIDVTFTVKRAFEQEDRGYGPATKYILRADTGHSLSWITGSFDLEEGKTYTGNFAVKRHYEGKYGKETQINRPRKGQPTEVE